MKKLFFYSLLLLNTILYSQGNLQFNQVKLIAASETVPTNKVWKIESVLYTPHNFTSNTVNNEIILNGTNLIVRTLKTYVTSINYGDYSLVWEQTFPIWLPAGSTVASSTGVFGISVIEYNLIP
ncbi:MAG: hypothetical protein KA521_07635 [Crocinitomicaceae bacterium]|nr:hypothetical protein [Crocinitomicaceae bacterium]